MNKIFFFVIHVLICDYGQILQSFIVTIFYVKLNLQIIVNIKLIQNHNYQQFRTVRETKPFRTILCQQTKQQLYMYIAHNNISTKK